MTPPPGWRVCFALVPELARKGMVAVNAPGHVVGGEVRVVLLNCGREIVDLRDGDPVVTVWAEPVVEIEWAGAELREGQ